MTAKSSPYASRSELVVEESAGVKEVKEGIKGENEMVAQRKRNRETEQAERRRRRRRTRWWVAGALALVVGLGLAVFQKGRDGGRVASASPERVGSLEVSATEIDLGEVVAGRWVSPTFRLRNVGAESVTITVPRQGVETLEGC